jgi:hypothetical protein
MHHHRKEEAMMRLRLDLDRETSLALQDSASCDLRTMPSQAVVLIRKALGLPVPIPDAFNVYRDSIADGSEVSRVG